MGHAEKERQRQFAYEVHSSVICVAADSEPYAKLGLRLTSTPSTRAISSSIHKQIGRQVSLVKVHKTLSKKLRKMEKKKIGVALFLISDIISNIKRGECYAHKAE